MFVHGFMLSTVFLFFGGGGFAAVLVNNDVFLPKMSIIDSCF